MSKHLTHKDRRDVPTERQQRKALGVIKRTPSAPLTPAVVRSLAPNARYVGGAR